MFSYTFVPFIFTSATEQILVLSFRLLQLYLQLLARHLLLVLAERIFLMISYHINKKTL